LSLSSSLFRWDKNMESSGLVSSETTQPSNNTRPNEIQIVSSWEKKPQNQINPSPTFLKWTIREDPNRAGKQRPPRKPHATMALPIHTVHEDTCVSSVAYDCVPPRSPVGHFIPNATEPEAGQLRGDEVPRALPT
jgi:hypothetical protein